MADFQIRSDSVDVEQIMRQIRARIREKRGADYTEAELEQLANVKLERFLDPRGVRSDLVEQFRRRRVVAEAPPNYEFGETTLFETHRGLLRSLRRLFKPLLKLFFNPDKITSSLHIQSQVNTQGERRLRHLEEREPLYYELIHNLVVEVTRLGIDVHNLKMRVESLSSRLEFDERRGRALEGVVQYKAPAGQPPAEQPRAAAPRPATPSPRPTQPTQPTQPSQPQAAAAAGAAPAAPGAAPAGDAGTSGERRRRRRRRRRRPGQTLAQAQNGASDLSNGAAGIQAREATGPDRLRQGYGESAEAPAATEGPALIEPEEASDINLPAEDSDDTPAAPDDDWAEEDDDRGPESGTPPQ